MFSMHGANSQIRMRIIIPLLMVWDLASFRPSNHQLCMQWVWACDIHVCIVCLTVSCGHVWSLCLLFRWQLCHWFRYNRHFNYWQQFRTKNSCTPLFYVWRRHYWLIIQFTLKLPVRVIWSRTHMLPNSWTDIDKY